ncbi:MAG: carbon storage regulator CsrA [Desulfobacterales bacterium]
MLIITRKLGERIMIGDDIVVTLLEIKGSQARIGIEAPRDISIHRQEIFDRIRQENLNASRIHDEDLTQAATLWHGKKPE